MRLWKQEWGSPREAGHCRGAALGAQVERGGEGSKSEAHKCALSYPLGPGSSFHMEAIFSSVESIIYSTLFSFQPLEMPILEEIWLPVSPNYWRNPFTATYMGLCSFVHYPELFTILECLPFTPFPKGTKPAQGAAMLGSRGKWFWGQLMLRGWFFLPPASDSSR